MTKSEPEYDVDEMEKFLEFFRTVCDRFGPLIIRLGSGRIKYKEAINELGTLAHNTARAARRLSLDKVTDLCMSCEEMMAQAKRLEGPASEELMGWILLLGDQFEKYYRSCENDASVLAIFNPLIVNVPNVISK